MNSKVNSKLSKSNQNASQKSEDQNAIQWIKEIQKQIQYWEGDTVQEDKEGDTGNTVLGRRYSTRRIEGDTSHTILGRRYSTRTTEGDTVLGRRYSTRRTEGDAVDTVLGRRYSTRTMEGDTVLGR